MTDGMFRGTAGEYHQKFRAANTTPKKRTNWRKEVKRQKVELINQLIDDLRNEIRTVPAGWERGYNSAITKLEFQRDAL